MRALQSGGGARCAQSCRSSRCVSRFPLGAHGSTDIYLAPLSMQNGRPVVGDAGEPHASPGLRQSTVVHARQPSDPLHVDSRRRPVGHLSRRRLDARPITRVTTTPESEYSATVMPGGKRFSVIRVERDSTQRLWSFALDGSDPRVVLEPLKPVGYHAWIDPNNLALVRARQPERAGARGCSHRKSDTLARGIGRSLAFARRSGFSFVRHVDSTSTITAMTWPGRRPATCSRCRALAGSRVARPGHVLTPPDRRSCRGAPARRRGRRSAISPPPDSTDITRLAVSPDGKWLAIVAIPKPLGFNRPFLRQRRGDREAAEKNNAYRCCPWDYGVGPEFRDAPRQDVTISFRLTTLRKEETRSSSTLASIRPTRPSCPYDARGGAAPALSAFGPRVGGPSA